MVQEMSIASWLRSWHLVRWDGSPLDDGRRLAISPSGRPQGLDAAGVDDGAGNGGIGLHDLGETSGPKNGVWVRGQLTSQRAG